MDLKYLIFEKNDGIGRVILNVPATSNAINLEIRFELIDLFRNLADDNEVQAVILSGKGKNFCSGGDLTTMSGVTPVAGRLRLKKGQRLVKAMTDLEKPIVCAVQGHAAGAGMALAMACDLIVASEDARFSFGFVKVGLVPDWGTLHLLPMRIGMTRTKELLMTGNVLTAIEAEQIGLINRVVPRDKLEEEVLALATRLAHGPGQTLAMIKAALNRWPMGLEGILELESTMQAVAFNSQDFAEGREAFLQKRSPRFKGE